MKKNGFTFIEILGVITLLSLISVIVFIVVDKSLRDSKKTLGSVQIENIRSAASMWRTDHIELIPDDDYYEITLNTLINGGYIDSNIVNLNDENLFDPSIVIHIGLDAIFVGNDEFSNQFISREYVFGYTGSESVFDVPFSGKYKLEVWGAQGGDASDYSGGYGGYSSGTIILSAGDNLYINIGGQGESSNEKSVAAGGYNGGASGNASLKSDDYNYDGGGGGATHIALESGLLSTFSGKINKLLIVAGGGGGAMKQTYGNDVNHGYFKGGNGGGYSGTSGTGVSCTGEFDCSVVPTGGTQENGGTGVEAYNSSSYVNSYLGTFGQGGVNIDSDTAAGGGGGGFYGGATGGFNPGAGGSGYIGNDLLVNASMFCYNCAESNDKEIKTISTTGESFLLDIVSCSNGYSLNAISKCAKAGDGYVRITYLGKSVD